MITRQYQRILLEYLVQGQYERKEERPYNYCRILLIRITPCKNNRKKEKQPYDYRIILLVRKNRCKHDTMKDEQRYDYDIILLIRITWCKKKRKRKEGTKGQQESHGMDRNIKDQEKIYKEAFGTSKGKTSIHMKHPQTQRIRRRPRTTYPYRRLFILLLLLSRYQRHIILPPPSPRKWRCPRAENPRPPPMPTCTGVHVLKTGATCTWGTKKEPIGGPNNHEETNHDELRKRYGGVSQQHRKSNTTRQESWWTISKRRCWGWPKRWAASRKRTEDWRSEWSSQKTGPGRPELKPDDGHTRTLN